MTFSSPVHDLVKCGLVLALLVMMVATSAASQATLGRILEDFCDRSWVSQDGRRYAATATGELVADGVGGLIAVLETEQKLRPLVAYLPTEEFGSTSDTSRTRR